MTTYLELNKNLTDQEQSIKKEVHRFAEEVLRPASLELDKIPDPSDVIAEGSLFWDVFKQAYQLGHHIMSLPESLGGAGLTPLGRHIYTEEMAWGACDLALGIGVTSFPFHFAIASGNQDIMKDVVMPFVEDREARYIGCWAITEPQHGSDSLLVGTDQFQQKEVGFDLQARLDGDEWVISGQKAAWVSNGTIATHALTFLSIDKERGQAGGGVALIPLKSPGVTKGKPLNKLGQRALNQGEIFFDDVRIPRSYMIIDPNMYHYVIDSVLAGANAFMGASFTGVARAAFEEALAYSKQRVQGARRRGAPEHPAEVDGHVHQGRGGAAAFAGGDGVQPDDQSTGHAVPIASKVFCTEAAFSVASEAVQVHGGYGLAKEMLVEKLFRDARASMIEDGTNEVLSLAAARKVIDTY